MGHITICGEHMDTLIEEANRLKKLVKVEGEIKEN